MIERRSLSIAAGVELALPRAARAETRSVRPWPGVPPGGGGPTGQVEIGRRGAVSNIAVPTLEVFAPDRPNGTAMLVAGGDGYKRIEMESEARPAARWLAARGITAFVLAYRLPVEWHAVASGGHGFGMGRPDTPTMAWPGWYEAWLRRLLP